MNERRQLRLGVVGVGVRAELARHAGQAGGRVVACADPAARARDTARELFGPETRVVADHRDLVGHGLDGVFVTSPDHTHARVAIDFLRAGVAVYLEKPMATTVEDCDAILRAAQASGTLLFCGHNMRYMPVIETMKSLLDAGEIGEVKTVWCRHFVGHGGDFYFKDWHAEAAKSTGLLLQKGAHDIDVIHWLAGAHSDLVTGMGALQVYGDVTDRRDNSGRRMREWFDVGNWPPADARELNPVIDVEDTSMIHMRLANGVLASYQQCHFTPDYWRNYTIIGTRGRMENFGDTVDAEIRLYQRRSDYDPVGTRVVPVPRGSGGHGGADAAAVAEFLAAITGEAVPRTHPLDARAAVATGVAGTASIRTGSVPIRIDPPNLTHEAEVPAARTHNSEEHT
ncbi:Gfo/Idh/MocA family oxidoreductase [Phytoactinopolyspora alkaliphila]|uniref:Gfo/Idh/MocA family oxidoreductase n=1 Tax=Phytoactinopolyspora alkaliphila TaxID=1783498 RepID=A0A6N9YNH4_9ACTN|nr:Gfo/Idh/MocA family oxidoreductase [Phytoactinopolyspora alkaliphila]NED96596.1 Gfo/Idh/MocA family oxidoreductase [Phytoactinopolyspora alkaliphila]